MLANQLLPFCRSSNLSENLDRRDLIVLYKRNKFIISAGLAENVLHLLDAKSLYASELVSKHWHRVIANGMLWRKFIERKVRLDPLWRGLANKRGWLVPFSLFFKFMHNF